MLFGRDRERLERWKEVRENRRFFRPSPRLSVSAGPRVGTFSGVVVDEPALCGVDDKSSGSSDASREDGMESVRE